MGTLPNPLVPGNYFLELGPLDFVFTEYNHDFHTSIEINNHLQYYLDLFRHYDADKCTYLSPTSEETYIDTNGVTGRVYTHHCEGGAKKKWYNDDGIVKAVFCGYTKDGLRTHFSTSQGNFNLLDILVAVKTRYTQTEAQAIYNVVHGLGKFPTPVGMPTNLHYYITTKTNAKYRYYTPQDIANNSDKIYKEIFKYIPPTPGANAQTLTDIYIVSDATAFFTRNICLDPSFATISEPKNVHCMYSTTTFGDPSNLQHPNDNCNIDRPNSMYCKRYSWICATPLTKTNNAADTLIHASVEHRWQKPPLSNGATPDNVKNAVSTNNTPSYPYGNLTFNYHPNDAFQIGKTITHNDQTLGQGTQNLIQPLTYTDSRLETTKNAVNNQFNQGNTNGVDYYRRKLWTAQGKRLGDHEQVLFAKLLQNQDLYRENDWKLVDGIKGGTTPNDIVVAGWGTTNDDLGNWPRLSVTGTGAITNSNTGEPVPYSNNQNTFLTTGDWPCFCYAIYNKVNCILVVDEHWHVVTFN